MYENTIKSTSDTIGEIAAALGVPESELAYMDGSLLPEPVARYVHERLETVCDECPARQYADMMDICLQCPFERLGEVAAALAQQPNSELYLDTKDRFIGL